MVHKRLVGRHNGAPAALCKGMSMISIKTIFGQAFKTARLNKRLSRAALAGRLGISPKTIQSWEMGRTFVEKLDIIPLIEQELGVSFTSLLSDGIDVSNKNAPVISGNEEWVNIPLCETSRFSEAKTRTNKKVCIPRSWLPSGGGIPVAVRVFDSTLIPLVKSGGTVIIDRKRNVASRLINHIVGIQPGTDKLRIRRLCCNPDTGTFIAEPALPGRRGRFDFSPEAGHTIIGKVIGIIGQPL